MKKGDMITVCTGDGNDYGCMIDEITKDAVVLSVCYNRRPKASRIFGYRSIRRCRKAINWKT